MRSKRPAVPSPGRSWAYSPSIASNAAQIRSRTSANHVSTLSQWPRSGGKTSETSLTAGKQSGLTQRLGQRDGASKGNVERSGRRMQGNHHTGDGGAMHHLGCARALAAEKGRILRRKNEAVERHRPRSRHQNESRPGIALSYKRFP